MTEESNNKHTAKFTPPMSKLAQEEKLIALAYRQAQKQMEEGTASPAVLTHFLRLGTVREEVRLEKARLEIKYMETKIEAADAASRLESMYDGVLEALRSYK